MWVGDPKVVGLNSKRGDSLAATVMPLSKVFNFGSLQSNTVAENVLYVLKMEVNTIAVIKL